VSSRSAESSGPHDERDLLAALTDCEALELENFAGERRPVTVRRIPREHGCMALEWNDGGCVASSVVRALWFPPTAHSPVDDAIRPLFARATYRDGVVLNVRSSGMQTDALGVLLAEARDGRIIRRCIPWQALRRLDAYSLPTATPSLLRAPAADDRHADETAGNNAQLLGLDVLCEQDLVPEQAALDLVPAEIARAFHMLPLHLADGKLHVAVADPSNREGMSMLGFVCNQVPILKIADAGAIDRAIDRLYPTLDSPLLEDEVSVLDAEPAVPENLEVLAQQAPIVRLVGNILVEGIRRHASDIHIRPNGEAVELVFRVDGDMILVRRFNKRLLASVVGRIKVMGRMDITQRRVPQDGQTCIVEGGRRYDLRISVIPTIEGESVVIRVLNPTVEMTDIGSLGMSNGDARHLGDLLSRTSGLVLVTGPTGSGKSTTLFACLKTVMARNVNIITVENPVEYRIPGIEQVPVATEQGMTFAKALRNILRHDPDVIMVGEIRDSETARIAVESGLTGHLVLSTLHTNSAVGTMSRLLEMGTDDYLIRATLLAVIAQRLVRKICPACRVPDEASAELRTSTGAGMHEPFYRGRGCPQCQGRGYRGRRMAYELLTMTPELRQLVTRNIDAERIQRQAIADGMLPLPEHALALARAGEISLSEALVTRND
jgi:type IV pilus assembly protein PilB